MRSWVGFGTWDLEGGGRSNMFRQPARGGAARPQRSASVSPASRCLVVQYVRSEARRGSGPQPTNRANGLLTGQRGWPYITPIDAAAIARRRQTFLQKAGFFRPTLVGK